MMPRLPGRLRAPAATSLLTLVLLASTMLVAPSGAQAVTPSADREILWAQNCMGYERRTVPNPNCIYGDRYSSRVVALIGDSHAAHLFPAINRIAIARHWKLVVMVKVSCAFLDIRVRNLYLGREYYECATWNRNVLSRLYSLRPALTIVAASHFAIHPVRYVDRTITAEGLSIGRMLNRIPGAVSLIVDSPYRGGYTRYIPKSVALSGSLGAIERVATTYSHDPLINLTGVMCPTWSCPVVVGGITKFRDSTHLTATYSRVVLGAPGGVLDRALAARLP
jgi:hypothetical protein